MEFCEECGSMMKKNDDEWICSTCSPEKAEQNPATRKAVVVICPECQKQRPYCGIDGGLAPIKWKQGIERHLDYHDLTEKMKKKYRREALNKKETKEVPRSLCEESDNRGWDNYGL